MVEKLTRKKMIAIDDNTVVSKQSMRADSVHGTYLVC